MKNLAKKLLVFSLTLALVLSLCPVTGVFATATITGDASILLPPANETTRVAYSLTGADTTDVVWSVANAPAGVSIMPDGGLLVNGTVERGNTFKVQAKDRAGSLLAEKEVYIPTNGDFYYWADVHQFFVDFQSYAVGIRVDHGQTHMGNTRWFDYLLRATVSESPDITDDNGVIREEADGNRYMYVFGRYENGSLLGCAGIAHDAAQYNGTTSLGGSWFNDHNILTYEADFMVTASVLETMDADTVYSLFTEMSASIIDICYKKLDASTIGIYYQTADDGMVQIGSAPIDTWFKVAFCYKQAARKVDFYLNNRLVAENVIANTPTLHGKVFYAGAPIDNLAAYTGTPTAYMLPSGLPEAIYLTPSNNEIPVTLDTNVYFGIYTEAGNKATYTGAGLRFADDKMFIADGDGDVTVRIQDAKHGLDEAVTIKRADGIEFNYDDGIPGISEGSAVVVDNKLDTTTGSAVYNLNNMAGDLMLTYDTVGGGTAELETAEGFVSIDFGEYVENSKVVILAKTNEKTYEAYCGTNKVAEGALSDGALQKLTLSGSLVDNLIVSSIAPVAPYVFEPTITGVYAVDQNLTAEYTYYSPWKAAEKGVTVIWSVAETEDGTYVPVGTGVNWIPNNDIANKYVKYSIQASDGTYESLEVSSPAVLVKPLAELNRVENTLTTTIQNHFDTDLYAVAQCYNAGALEKTLVEEVVFTGDSYEWVEDVTGYDGIAVILFDKASLIAISSRMTVGSVPTEIASASGAAKDDYVKDGKLYLCGEKGDMLSVLIYNHQTDAGDLSVSYGTVYERDDILAAVGDDSLSDKLVYATSVQLDGNGQTALKLPALEDGSYLVDIIAKSGLVKEHLFMDSPEAILNPTGMSLPGFVNVMKLYSDKDAAEVEAIFDYLNSISVGGKEYVAKMMASKDYDMEWFDLSACLVRYLESTSFDKALYDRLIAEMRAAGLSTNGVTLMQYDAKPHETGRNALNKTWTTFEELLAPLYDDAILLGIYHVQNYMEADTYLKELTDTVYATSSYQANICNLVAGKLYGSVAELKAAVNGYQPVSGNNTSSLGVSVSGNKGTLGAGISNIIQSGAAVETAKPIFSDVSAGHWAEEAIGYLNEMNIISGRPDGSFAPEATITRAEYIKILCEAFELSSSEKVSFADVAANAWYARYASVAGALGIAQGSEGNFRPNDSLTREDAAVLLQRVLVMLGQQLPSGNAGMGDQDEIAVYAKDAVRQLQAAGLINGMEDGNFYPKNLMTRAQCAQVIFKALRGGNE